MWFIMRIGVFDRPAVNAVFPWEIPAYIGETEIRISIFT